MTDRGAAVLMEAMRRERVIPVLTIGDDTDAVGLARALVEGGLTHLEITLRTKAALGAIEKISHAVHGAVVGAGTVLSAHQGAEAISAGARFLVSPGATAKLYEAATSWRAPLLPGVATATEAMMAMEHGYHFVKFFPAEQSGGVAALKALAGPLAGLKFCPTGGVGPKNLGAYLACPNVVCVGGSWVAPSAAVEAGDWREITQLASEARVAA
jgi:2-dehydro-3-deoxyphosphogluconate aldolase/(4S)-4-hydroxy-2-oxoglutarate aldolase